MFSKSIHGDASSSWDVGEAESYKFHGEIFAEDDALTTKLSTLLKILKVSGLIFESKIEEKAYARASRELKDKNCETSWSWTKIYSTTVLVILWLNAMRLLSAFSQHDEFGILLINKLATISFFFQSAIKCTAYYVASRHGLINTLLRRLKVSTDFLGVVRKLKIGHIVFSAQCDIIYSGFFLYAVIIDSSEYFWFLCAPIGSEASMSSTWLYVTKFSCYLVSFLAIQAYIWPACMDQLLTEILVKQFHQLNRRFRLCCSRQGHFSESIKTFRNRHQHLCREVRLVDSLFMLTNVSFCCQMFTVIIVLYALTFIKIQNGALANVFSILLITSILGLIITTRNGTLLNNSVSMLLLFFAQLLKKLFICIC